MNKKLKAEKYQVIKGEKVKLKNWPTLVKEYYCSEKDYEERLKIFQDELQCHQEKLYAEKRHALLIVFQGMDTAGKDGAIKHVMAGVSPQGSLVISFKTPTSTDLEHDFLWRVHREVPARGQIGIFNRSYYEDVLVPRVHRDVLSKQQLPEQLLEDKNLWKNRCKDILNHEEYLTRQGYVIIKIFLHLSKDEQKRRLQERLDDRDKNWKISTSDFEEREFWDKYMKAYEYCFEHTASESCPWYIVPADDKKNARLIISRIILDRFQAIKLRHPKLDPKVKEKLPDLKAGIWN